MSKILDILHEYLNQDKPSKNLVVRNDTNFPSEELVALGFKQSGDYFYITREEAKKLVDIESQKFNFLRHWENDIDRWLK